MHTTPATQRARPAAPPVRRAVRLLIAAAGFVVAYLLVDLVTGMLATTALPRPTDPIGDVRAWFDQYPAAAIATGLCQAASVALLAWFVTEWGDRRARRWGYLAVGLMLLSCCCAWVLAAVAGNAGSGVLTVLRQINFVAGGTAHVLVLGLFVLLASWSGSVGRPLRVFAAITAAVGALSLVSLVLDPAAALILLGRVLAMIWLVCAAIAVLRRSGTARAEPGSNR